MILKSAFSFVSVIFIRFGTADVYQWSMGTFKQFFFIEKKYKFLAILIMSVRRLIGNIMFKASEKIDNMAMIWNHSEVNHISL